MAACRLWVRPGSATTDISPPFFNSRRWLSPTPSLGGSAFGRSQTELPKKTIDLLPPNRELFFSLHVLPGTLISCLQIGIVEDLCAGTIDMLSVAGDHPDLLGKTGHRPRPGTMRESPPVPDQLRLSIKIRLGWFLFKRDRPYQAGRSKHWIKVKNRKTPAMDREFLTDRSPAVRTCAGLVRIEAEKIEVGETVMRKEGAR